LLYQWTVQTPCPSATDNPEIVFSARRSELEPCLCWRLTGDALICERGAMPKSLLSWMRVSSLDQWPPAVPLHDIVSIRLRFDPTRFASNRFRCDLQSGNGARISIFSTHYAGFGEFEDRGDQYAVFTKALILRVQELRPSLNLEGGVSWASYLVQHGLLLLALIALVTMLGIAGVPMFGATWVKFAIVLTYIGLAVRYAWINIPRSLAPPPQPERDS
jgi:hypothetical protein